MTLYPTPLDQRLGTSLQNLQAQVKTLTARTMGIDSGTPLMSLPGVIDPGYVSGDPMVFVNGAAVLSGPYQVVAPYVPVAGQAVTLQPVQSSYAVLGPVASATPATATNNMAAKTATIATVNATTLAAAGASTLTGAVTAGSTLGVTGAATVGSTLGVTGAATMDSTLAVAGNTTVSGTLTAGNLTAGNFPTFLSGTSEMFTGSVSAGTNASVPAPATYDQGFFTAWGNHINSIHDALVYIQSELKAHGFSST